MHKKSTLIFTALLVPLDFLMLLSAGLLAYSLRTSEWVAQYRPVLFTLNLPFARYLWLVIFVSLFLILVFALIGLYKMRPFHKLIHEFYKIVIGISAGIMSLVFYVFIRNELFDSRFIILAAWGFAIILVVLGRFILSLIQKKLMSRGYGLQRVLLIKDNDEFSNKLLKYIKEFSSLGYKLVGQLNGLDMNLLKEKVAKSQPDVVILANPDCSKEKMQKLVHFCDSNHLIFKFVPNLFHTLTKNSIVENLEGIPLIEIRRNPLDGWWRIAKRLFDIIFSFSFLVVFSWLYLLIALAIYIENPGPVIYRDYRYGYKKKRFVFYKFRSMKADMNDGAFGSKKGNELRSKFDKDPKLNLRKGSPLIKVATDIDPRVTKVGRFIRKTSMDELTQFLNVLKGDMSVVGFRPHIKKEVERYTDEQSKMFCAKPGVTGLSQVSGRSGLEFDEEARLDVFYIENWSFLLDLIIILKTPFVMTSEEAKTSVKIPKK